MPKNRNGTLMLNSSITTTKCQQSLVNSNLNKAMELHKVMEVMLVTTKRHHRHQCPQQTPKQQEIANLRLKLNLKQEVTRVTVNNKEASMVVTNSNKVTASNQLETVPSSSMVSRNHPSNNSRDNMVSNPRLSSSLSTDNNRVMASNKDTGSNLNRGSMVSSRVAAESHQHLRVPASRLRDSSSMVNSREVTAANSRAKTKGMVSSKGSNRIRGTAASRETRVKAMDSSRAARTRGMDSNRVKVMEASNKTRVMVSKGVREVTAREGPMLETVETRVEGQVMVTTSPGTITRGETALRPTGVAEDLMVEMTVKEGMTIEEAEEMTEEDTVVTAEEAVTWTDKVVLTGEITTEATIEEDSTAGKEGMIIVETEATTQMEMIIRAAARKRCNKKCRADHQATPFSSAGCPKMCPASKLVISLDKSALSRKTNELER